MEKQSLTVKGVHLDNIRNRNERRVVQLMDEVIREYYPDYTLGQLDIEDVYALTLNLLPARYVQQGTIVLQGKVSDYEIKSKIMEAVERVLAHPTHCD